MTHEQKQILRNIQLQGAYGQEAFSEGVYMPGSKTNRAAASITSRPM